MRLIKIVLCVLVIGLFSSCRKDSFNIDDANNINNLGGDTWVPGPIDNWISDSLTTPFNIAVKYKWDQFELDLDKTLVPPKEESIVPIMSAIKKVWIDSYIAEADAVFFKKYCPKFFSLVGSVAYESNGAVKLGTAEGGRKIVLYNFNNTRIKGMPGYTLADSFAVKEMFHTIHHEFAHILHQNILYPVDFKNLSPNLFTADWINYTDAEAQRDGFISAYAMNVVDDDFVETVSIMLVEGKAGFEKILSDIPDGITDRGTTQAQAIARLRAKETIVVNYFKQVWNIDFYSLQTRTRTAIESLIY